jgi:hypothetical protein
MPTSPREAVESDYIAKKTSRQRRANAGSAEISKKIEAAKGAGEMLR